MAKLTVLTPSWIRNFLNNYSQYAGLPFQAKALSAGTVNSIYQIQILKKPKIKLYLKVDEAGNPQRLRHEFLILRILSLHQKKLGFLSPVVIKQNDGRLCTSLGKKSVFLLSELPGTYVLPKKLQAQHFLQLGQALRKLHTLKLPQNARKHQWTTSNLAKLFKNLKSKITTRDATLARRIATKLKEFKTQDKHAQTTLIHGDLFFDNLHWQKNRLIGMLDFEYAGAGNAMYDVAMTLLALAWTGKKLDLSKCQAFWRGYRPTSKPSLKWRMAFEQACLTIVLTRLKTFEFGPLRHSDTPYRDYRDFLARLKWAESSDFSIS